MAEWTPKQLKAVAQILLGAAHADGRFQLEEEAIIVQLLAQLLDSDDLPDELTQQLRLFDPYGFELEQACQQLALKDASSRQQLLRLVAQVTEVDEIHDLDESHYILRVARAIGAEPAEYDNLTVDVSTGGAAPPPVPRG